MYEAHENLLRVVSGEMMSLEGDDNPDDLASGGGGGGKAKSNNRTDRKRLREQRRRMDLTNAFNELATFIFEIEPEAGDPDVGAKKQRKRSGSASGNAGGFSRAERGEDTAGITRLDLIGRALRIMKRLHKENEERKRMIEHMRERRPVSSHSDNVSFLF